MTKRTSGNRAATKTSNEAVSVWKMTHGVKDTARFTAGSALAKTTPVHDGTNRRSSRRGAAKSPGPVARATTAVTALLSEASWAELDQVIAVASGRDEEDADPALWGPGPSRSETAVATVANLRKQFARRRELEGASLSRAEAAELIGISEQAVSDSLESHRLLGFKRGRRWVIPIWQFDADAEQGMLPGLSEIAQVFPGGAVALSDWVTRPSVDLDDRTPRDVLVRGEVEPIVRLARNLTAAAW